MNEHRIQDAARRLTAGASKKTNEQRLIANLDPTHIFGPAKERLKSEAPPGAKYGRDLRSGKGPGRSFSQDSSA